MKVAIPTNDSTKISDNILTCKGYLIFVLEDHTLVNYSLVPNAYSENIQKAEDEICTTLSDCTTIICNKIETKLKNKLKESKKQILLTLEENAKKALINLMCRV